MLASKSDKKLITSTEVKINKKIILEGNHLLKELRFTTTVEMVKQLDPLTNGPYKIISSRILHQDVDVLHSFPLVQVTPEQLLEYRMMGIPSFVLKTEGKFFYTAIPKSMNFLSSPLMGSHQCAVVGRECNRLSAASDEDGGCEKVRNRSNYIERYPWITTGYETFNTKHTSFVVVNCLHYEKCPTQRVKNSSK